MHSKRAFRDLYTICRQRRPRSDCAFAQSDQGLRFPPTDHLDNVVKKSGVFDVHTAADSEGGAWVGVQSNPLLTKISFTFDKFGIPYLP